MITTEDLVALADNRPGYSVVNYREVAMPVFRVEALVTLMAQQAIGPIEEFVLRAVGLSINNSSAIAQFLGLPEIVINKQLASSLYEGMISPVSNLPDCFELTKSGHSRVTECAKEEVSKEIIPFYVDGITRQIMPVGKESLYKHSEVIDLSISAIPPSPRRSPIADELDVDQMNTVLRVRANSQVVTKQVIKVDALVNKTYLYFRPAYALAFKSTSGRSVSIAFMIDGILSEIHEKLFMESNGALRSVIFKDMFDSKKRRQEIQNVYRDIQRDIELPSKWHDLDDKSGRRRVLSLPVKQEMRPLRVDEGAIKTLSVYEHPMLLEEAITSATKRLFIISPFIRANVVNQTFMDRILDRLENHVKVTIVYGMGRIDRNESADDQQALEHLRNWTARFENFNIVRATNFRSRILLVDSRFLVATSFNWLSYKGDIGARFREEEGICVTDPSAIDGYYLRLKARVAALD